VVTGKVIRFDEIRGYGFVSPDAGGEDVFIHVNDLDFDKRLLVPGAQVEFLAEEGDRGLKASQVRILTQAAPAPSPQSAIPTAKGTRSSDDDALCDVLSAKELSEEFTEAVLVAIPDITAAQLLGVRQCLLTLAHAHGWID
jgi:cold shock CspA family protein